MPKSFALLRIVPAIAWLLSLGAGLLAAQAGRPNFIVFIADDMAWNDCGAYGHPRIRTPNLDRLARQGMRFDRAFLTTSSCSPSRASILTGRYPHNTNAQELHMPLPADQVLLTQPLRQAGYYTAAAGKWHLGGAVRKQFDRIADGGGPSACENWLPVLRQRPKDKPFFLWLAASDPHRPYAPGALSAPHSAADAILPPFLPDTLAVRNDLALYYDEISRMDSFIGKVLDELASQGLDQTTFVLFLSDNGRPFPRCKTTLYDDGIKTPFLVRYPGKVMAGSTSASLLSAVDIAPTILDLAGVTIPSSFQGKSFAPVLSEAAATVRPYAFAEHNWHDYMAFKRAVRSPQYTYIRNWLPELTLSPPADAVSSPTFAAMRQLRDAGQLPESQRQCFLAPRPEEELYDLESDPHSLKNLAADPQHAAVLAEMRKALEDWQAQTRDTFDRQKLTPDRFDRQTGKKNDE